MSRLIFQVQGSQAQPYTVTATGGGADFHIKCSCPASRRAAKMCKHVAALLVGDVTKLVQPSDSVVELGRLAEGSHYVVRAVTHNPVHEKNKLDMSFQSLEDIANYIAPLVAVKNYEMLVQPYGDGSCISIYKRFKNGKRQKHPAFILAHQFEMWDTVMMEDGTYEKRNFRPRVRPWLVSANGTSGSWKDINGAAGSFVAAVKGDG